MKRLLLWLWQFPQNLCAIIIIKFLYTDNNSYCTLKSKGGVYFYSTICRSCFMDDFTLGDYIFISADSWFSSLKLRKSYGYVLSSRILGPLWIPVIVIPRIFYAYYDPVGYYQRKFYTEEIARRLTKKRPQSLINVKRNNKQKNYIE